jgi:hypothetical protein
MDPHRLRRPGPHWVQTMHLETPRPAWIAEPSRCQTLHPRTSMKSPRAACFPRAVRTKDDGDPTQVKVTRPVLTTWPPETLWLTPWPIRRPFRGRKSSRCGPFSYGPGRDRACDLGIKGACPNIRQNEGYCLIRKQKLAVSPFSSSDRDRVSRLTAPQRAPRPPHVRYTASQPERESPVSGAFAEPSNRLELLTPSLPWRCSTN